MTVDRGGRKAESGTSCMQVFEIENYSQSHDRGVRIGTLLARELL